MASEQPIVAGVAGRYATALFNLALEQKALDKHTKAWQGCKDKALKRASACAR